MRARSIVPLSGAVALAAVAATAASGAHAPKLVIYSSLPEHGLSHDQARDIEDGARIALSERHARVGKYRVVYRRLDDSLRSTGAADEGRAARNARRATKSSRTIAYIGEYNSYASRVTIPMLNKAGIAQVSPSNTYNGLTVNGPGSEPGEPDKYYPTGVRTYARVQPNDRVQGAALVTATRDAGCGSVHVFFDSTTYSRGLARIVERTAPSVGLQVEGSDEYDPQAGNYRSLAARTHARCVIMTGEIERHGVRVLKDVARADSHPQLYGADGICLDASTNPQRGIPPKLAPRFHCTIATLAPKAFPPAGRAFFARFIKRYHRKHPDPYAIYGYESMALMLDSMQRAQGPDGTIARRAVVDALFATRDRQSVLGTYSIDGNGDTTLLDYGLYRIAHRRLRFDRTIHAVAPVVAR